MSEQTEIATTIRIDNYSCTEKARNYLPSFFKSIDLQGKQKSVNENWMARNKHMLHAAIGGTS